jgi:dephospho-CoA kinase
LTGDGKTRGFILGVTGGIASGKSTVARMLEQLGAPLVDFDVLAREVVAPGQPALAEIVDHFGDGVLLPGGELDRAALSEIVYRDPERRRVLEGITHPRIAERYARRVEEYIDQNPGGIIQAVVPLLFEAGMQQMFDRVLVVYIPESEQIRRLVARDRIDEEKARSILAAQLSIEDKRQRADEVIDNSGTGEETRAEVERLYRKLERLRESPGK